MTNTEYPRIKVRFIGADDPLALRNGKIYDAIIGQLGMLCIVDETGEEYGYPPSPELFEVIEDCLPPSGHFLWLGTFKYYAQISTQAR